MDIDDSVLYASAALFVLACYSLSIESGCQHRVGGKAGAWGVPLEVIAEAITSRRDRTSSGWGWELVGPGGLCDRVFRSLNLRPAASASLLSLPEGLHPLETEPQREDFLNLVQVFARHIDPEIGFQGESDRAAIHVCKGSSNGASPPRAVSPDVQDEHEASAEGTETLSSEPSALDELTLNPEELEKREEEALRQALMALQDDPEAMQRINTQTRSVEDAALIEGAALPEPLFVGCDVYAHKACASSFAALRALVTACLLKELPTPQSSPSLHWYDARSRVIMLRVAHWLRVPRASFHALELELMGDVTPAEALEVSQASLHSYHSKRMKWLKVGAAAVGGGVLTAVTAGLAAPAIVAGVGTLVGLTGSAGAAATITGAATSAASLSIVSGGSGAAGAAFYSSKMAKRSADVTEFGFVRLSAWHAHESEPQCVNSRSNSIQYTSHEASTPNDSALASSACRPSLSEQLDATANSFAGASPVRAVQQGSIGASASKSPATPSSVPALRNVASMGALPSAAAECQEAEASTSTGWSPGSAKKRSWKQWGKQKLWRGNSASSTDALPATPDPLSAPEPLPSMVLGSAEAFIAVNGWLGQREDFIEPFQSLGLRQGNTMALVWESRELMAVRTAFRRLLARSASIQTVQLALYATVSGLATATIWPVAVLNCATLIDSAWDVACLRAESGGKLLANILAARLHGDRPVFLLGVSVGARLVYYCLLELYKLGAQGIVEHAVLLGAPVAIETVKLQTARSVVAGRFINGFCMTDWLLALCSRTKIGQSAFKPVAGLRPVSVPGIEDMDFTSIGLVVVRP